MVPRDFQLLAAVFVCGAQIVLAQDDASSVGLAGQLELRAHKTLIDQFSQDPDALRPFETDGCSGGLSEVWNLISGQFPEFSSLHEDTPPWESCCVTHDRVYHNAGGASTAVASYQARVRADAALRSCVLETGESRKSDLAPQYKVTTEQVMVAYGLIADAMHLAVRFGGAPCSALPWRWGYGFPDCTILQQNSMD